MIYILKRISRGAWRDVKMIVGTMKKVGSGWDMVWNCEIQVGAMTCDGDGWLGVV